MSRALGCLAALVSISCVAVSSSFSRDVVQDSLASQAPAASQPAGGQPAPGGATSTPDAKKTKKVWTNDNLTEVSGSAISQIGSAQNDSSGKNTAAKPVSSQVVAGFRKQLGALQAQLASIDKQIADLKSFNKGESSQANGLQMHKNYTMEPVQDQVVKLEEKRRSLAAQMDAVFDAARKRGIEPGQLR